MGVPANESTILRAVHLALGTRSDCRMWRQQVAIAVPVGMLCRECRSKSPIRYGIPGQPDLFGIHKGSGKLISCEVKAENGRMTGEQLAWSAMMDAFNAINLSGHDGVRSVEQALARLEEAIK